MQLLALWADVDDLRDLALGLDEFVELALLRHQFGVGAHLDDLAAFQDQTRAVMSAANLALIDRPR
jgi:hypothetical protein